MVSVEIAWCSRAHLGRMVDDVACKATVVEPMQLVDIYNRHGGSTTVKIPKRDPATLCLPNGLFESIECGARLPRGS